MTIHAELLGDLAAAFPKQQLTARTLSVYMEDLADLPPVELARALLELRRTCDWFPTIAQIRERTAELALGLPGEAEALAQVEGRVRWSADRATQMPTLHPIVKAALDLVGGAYAFRTTDEPGVIRGQFLRLFRELRAEAIRGAQLDGRALAGGRPMLPVSCYPNG